MHGCGAATAMATAWRVRRHAVNWGLCRLGCGWVWVSVGECGCLAFFSPVGILRQGSTNPIPPALLKLPGSTRTLPYGSRKTDHGGNGPRETRVMIFSLWDFYYFSIVAVAASQPCVWKCSFTFRQWFFFLQVSAALAFDCPSIWCGPPSCDNSDS